MIARRANKSGDGSYQEKNVWGYGDSDIDKEDQEELEDMADEKR